MNLFNGSCNNCIYGDGKPITCNECEGMEPSYNQNYNDNYYPHESPSFPYCDSCGESHETFQCQPIDQNIDFSGSNQIQTLQYPEIHPPSHEISDEVFQDKGDLMKSIQTFLEEFNYIPFEEKPQMLLQTCSNQEKEGPSQDFDIRQLVREECCVEVSEEQKQNMEDTIIELVEICHQKELLCMHDNVDDLIESAHNSKLLSINSQLAPILSTNEPEYSPSMGYEHPNTTPKTESDGIIKSGVEELIPFLSENEVTSEDKKDFDMPVCENSPICDDHFDIFSDSKNDDDISSDDDDFEDIEYVEASLPDPEIVSVEEENVVHKEEEEVELEDVFQIQDIVLREKLLSINCLISNIESLNDNPTPDRMLNSSVSFPISEEFDNSLLDNFSPEFETFCDHTKETRSGSTTTHTDDSLPEYDSFCFEIELDQEMLINVLKSDIFDESTNDPLLEEADLFLTSDNSIPPGIENFADDSEGDIHFLEALLIDDSIPFPNNESSESNFDNPSFPRPPPEPPDAELDFKPDSEEEIPVVMNDEFDDDGYSSFMFLIYSKVFYFLLFAESEDSIFDPGKDYAQNVKNQSKTRQYQHKIGSLHQKPNQRAFFSSNQAKKPTILCGNNSHDGYDCQQQFPFVYEKEPSYNQNYDDNYYSHESPSFSCCDNCGGSHETFQCQPMDQNVDFSGSDQIQTPQYPEVHPPSQEISDEVFQSKGDLMKSIQTFLEEFNYITFEEKPQILLQAWYKFFAIQYAQPEDSNELFQKLLEDLKELAEYVNSPRRDHPTFSDNNEDHFEVSEEQKQNMEDTILELVEICRQKELLCMHDNVDDLIESALNSKLLSINSQLHAVVPILSTKEPEYSSSMGYENPNTTPETEKNEIIKSGVEELVPVLSENEVTAEDKRECDMLVCENSPTCDDHSDIFSDSNNDDDISSDDDDFEDIEYVKASLLDPEIVSLAEENGVEQENDVYQEEEEVDLEDVFQIQDIVLREKLLSINRLIANIKSLNDNPTPDRVLNSSVSFLISEESNNSLSYNSSPEFETFCDHTEETRSGNTTTHADNSLPEDDSFCFEIELDQERLINVVKNDIPDDSSNDPLLEEVDLFLASDNSIPPGIENFAYDSEGDIRYLEALLINDSIPFPNNESSESNFDNPSFPRPPPEPPDAKFDFEPDAGDEILVVMNDRSKFDDYSSFMFVIYSNMFISFLFAESEDTIFDPGKDYAQNVKNQTITTQDWKSAAKAGSTSSFPQQSANEA
uniref:Uncharacterized protein n=1 Tax=Tanacetum cinerariifolium TaxID=118510 RepID=A0A6L2KGM9_TANCI|nr:hypothetical protein [Tanacetum cinerariifolium]